MSEAPAIPPLDYLQVNAFDVLASALVLAGGTPRLSADQFRLLGPAEFEQLVACNPVALGEAFVVLFTNDVVTFSKLSPPDRERQGQMLERLRLLWTRVALPDVTVAKNELPDAILNLAALIALKSVNGAISIALKTRIRQDIGPIQRTVNSLVTLRSVRARSGKILADDDEPGPSRPAPPPTIAASIEKPATPTRVVTAEGTTRNLDLARRLAIDSARRKSSIEQVDEAKAARDRETQSSALDEGKSISEGTRVILHVSLEQQLRSFLDVSHMIDRRTTHFRVYPDPQAGKNLRILFEPVAVESPAKGR